TGKVAVFDTRGRKLFSVRGYSSRWAAAGRLIVTQRATSSVIVDRQGLPVKRLTDEAVAVSADGRLVALVGLRRLTLVDPVTLRTVRTISVRRTQEERNSGENWASFTPDGREVAYMAGWRGHVTPVRGGRSRPLPAWGGVWSLDGHHYAYLSTRLDGRIG